MGLLHDAALGDADVVAGGVFDEVHHFISLADNVVRSFRIMRIGGNAHGSANVKVQPFFLAESAGAKGVAEALGHA